MYVGMYECVCIYVTRNPTYLMCVCHNVNVCGVCRSICIRRRLDSEIHPKRKVRGKDDPTTSTTYTLHKSELL